MTINDRLHGVEQPQAAGSVSSDYKAVSKTFSVMTLARIAGALYLLIAFASAIAHGYVPAQLLVAGDSAATSSNIVANETLLRVGGAGSELVVLLSEIVLTVLLYILFKPVSRIFSLLAAFSRLAVIIIHSINLLNYFFVLQLLGGASYLTVFEADQLQAMALLFLNAHHYGFTIGITFFALNVFVMGYLIFRSGFFPKILGVLFAIAATGYLIDSFSILLLPNYAASPIYLVIPITIAEISFPLWLLIKGVNTKQWEKRALEAVKEGY